MITQLILNFLADLIAGLVGLLNFSVGVLDTVAMWLGGGSGSSAMSTSSGSSFGSFMDALAIVDPFVPRTAIFGALSIMLGLGVAMFAIWLVRFILSLVTGGGGATA